MLQLNCRALCGQLYISQRALEEDLCLMTALHLSQCSSHLEVADTRDFELLWQSDGCVFQLTVEIRNVLSCTFTVTESIVNNLSSAIPEKAKCQDKCMNFCTRDFQDKAR